jgi:pimeloyl-ACP methyl ester carboxylesterase
MAADPGAGPSPLPDVALAHCSTTWGVMRSRTVGTPRAGIPQVVVVPGLAVADYLQPALCELGAWTRAHLVELPGFSGSGEPPHPLDVGQFTDAVVQWLDASGLSGVVLAGHSSGTQVAARVAVRRPRDVRALVLASPTIDPRFRSLRRVLLAWRRNHALEPPSLDAQHTSERQRAGLRRVRHALSAHLAVRRRARRAQLRVDDAGCLVRPDRAPGPRAALTWAASPAVDHGLVAGPRGVSNGVAGDNPMINSRVDARPGCGR